MDPLRSSSFRPAASWARLLPSAALLVVVLLAAHFGTDRAAAPAIAFSGLVAVAVLAPLAIATRGFGAPLAALHLLVAPTLILAPRHGALPLALLTAMLAVAVAYVGGELAREAGRLRFGALFALAVAAQLVVHADRLWLAPRAPATFAFLVLAPLVAAGSLFALGRSERTDQTDQIGRSDRTAALVVGGAAFAAGPGLSLGSSAALVGAAILSRLVPRAPAALWALVATLPALTHEPAWAALALTALAATSLHARPRLATSARFAVALLVFGTVLTAAPPWQRRSPLESLLARVGSTPFARLEEPALGGPRALAKESPRAEWALASGAVGAVALDSFLLDGAQLACDTPVATIRIEGGDGRVLERDLVVGADSGDWASGRPDVAATVGCAKLVPHALWFPEAGRFFGRSFRARFRITPKFPAQRLIVERAAELPDGVRLVVERVWVER